MHKDQTEQRYFCKKIHNFGDLFALKISNSFNSYNLIWKKTLLNIKFHEVISVCLYMLSLAFGRNKITDEIFKVEGFKSYILARFG